MSGGARTRDDQPITVGTRCVVERRAPRGVLVQLSDRVVVKVTPRRAYLSATTWFALDDPTREVRPRYLDYLTTVTRIRGEEEA